MRYLFCTDTPPALCLTVSGSEGFPERFMAAFKVACPDSINYNPDAGSLLNYIWSELWEGYRQPVIGSIMYAFNMTGECLTSYCVAAKDIINECVTNSMIEVVTSANAVGCEQAKRTLTTQIVVPIAATAGAVGLFAAAYKIYQARRERAPSNSVPLQELAAASEETKLLK